MTVIQELHRAACEMGADTYKDPGTGYQVFTEYALLKKGDCCGNACRHCPYGHIKVNKPGHEPKVKTTVGGDVKPFEDGQFRGFSLSKVYSSVYGLFFLSVSVFIDHFYGIECHSCGRPKN